MIKAIIFDWFGVCTQENWKNCVARDLHKKLGVDEETIKTEFRKLLQPFARGDLSPEEFLEKFITSLDKNQNPKDYYYLFETIPALNQELLDYILELKKKYPIYLLSNSFGPVYPNYEKQIDFHKYFDKLFLSHELRLSKTQDEIWDKILPEIEFQPNELAFVDNTKKYFEPATKFGVNPVLFLNNEQTKKDLAELGVSVE